MSVRTESSGQTVTAYLEGEIDHHSAARIREKIDREIDGGNVKLLILDFRDVTFMDSSGIALILRSQQRMQLMEGSVVLRNVPEQARRVLDAAGIGRLVSIQ